MEQVEDELYKCEESASYAQKSFAIQESDLRHELSVAKEKLSKEEDQKTRLSRKLSQTRKRLQNVRNGIIQMHPYFQISANCEEKNQRDLRSCPICEEKPPTQTEPVPAVTKSDFFLNHF